jgi:hypothetical protein
MNQSVLPRMVRSGGNVANRHRSFIVGSWTNGGPENDPETVERIQIGLRKLPELADELGTTQLWIVTNGRESWDMVNTLPEAVDPILGSVAAKRLRRGEAVQWGKYTVNPTTTRNLSSDPVGGAVLALFLPADSLKKLDMIYRRNSVVVIEFMDDAKAWKKRWQPTELATEMSEAVANTD